MRHLKIIFDVSSIDITENIEEVDLNDLSII